MRATTAMNAATTRWCATAPASNAIPAARRADVRSGPAGTALAGAVPRPISFWVGRIPPITQRFFIYRFSRSFDQRQDRPMEASRLFFSDTQSQAADDPGDAQVIVVERHQPMVVRPVEGEHPVACPPEISHRRTARTDRGDLIVAQNRRAGAEAARFGQRKQPLNVVMA